MPERVALINLGCPKNLVDAEVMLGHLRAEGYETASDLESADVVVVNTCGFLEAAAQESVDTLLEAAGKKGRGRLKAVIAAGCMTQRYGADVADAMPEVDGFLGVGQAHQLPAVIRRALNGERPSILSGPSAGFEGYGLRLQATDCHTAYLKISEGCDRKCAFCIIPQIRGSMVSRPIDTLVHEAELLAAQGVRELVLIGQDPVRYGADLSRGGSRDGQLPLVELLTRLNGISDLRWVRLMYLFPDRSAEAVLETIAALPKVCKYVDMPLQHVSPEVLRAMNRPGGTQDYRRLLTKIRGLCPEVSIRSTFISGFPGETDAHHDEVADFLEMETLDWMGVFRYSPEEGTPAAERPQVSPEIAKSRCDDLMRRQQSITATRNRRWLGRQVEVLVEKVLGENGEGRTQGQAPDIDGTTRLDLSMVPDVRTGDFILAEVTGVAGYDLEARALELVHRSPKQAPGLLRIGFAERVTAGQAGAPSDQMV
jgi:ribosomal protein S12 methylthiotransferase